MDAERLKELRKNYTPDECFEESPFNVVNECLDEIERQQKEIERLTRWQEEVERCGCLCSKCIVANNIVECSEKYPDSDNCLKSIRLELDARAEKEAVSHD